MQHLPLPKLPRSPRLPPVCIRHLGLKSHESFAQPLAWLISSIYSKHLCSAEPTARGGASPHCLSMSRMSSSDMGMYGCGSGEAAGRGCSLERMCTRGVGGVQGTEGDRPSMLSDPSSPCVLLSAPSAMGSKYVPTLGCLPSLLLWCDNPACMVGS